MPAGCSALFCCSAVQDRGPAVGRWAGGKKLLNLFPGEFLDPPGGQSCPAAEPSRVPRARRAAAAAAAGAAIREEEKRERRGRAAAAVALRCGLRLYLCIYLSLAACSISAEGPASRRERACSGAQGPRCAEGKCLASGGGASWEESGGRVACVPR